MAERRAGHPDGWSPQSFYDKIAATFHLSHPDWEASIEEQGAALQRILADTVGEGSLRILDCACGIGTQLIGLAQHGHTVTGSDLSPGAIDRASHELSARGLEARLHVADMRRLPFDDGPFDAVIASIYTGAVRAYDVVRMLQRDGRAQIGSGPPARLSSCARTAKRMTGGKPSPTQNADLGRDGPSAPEPTGRAKSMLSSFGVSRA